MGDNGLPGDEVLRRKFGTTDVPVAASLSEAAGPQRVQVGAPRQQRRKLASKTEEAFHAFSSQVFAENRK